VDGDFLGVGLEVTLAERPGGGADRASDGSREEGGDSKKSGGEHYGKTKVEYYGVGDLA
jgi:hypothetical protein